MMSPEIAVGRALAVFAHPVLAWRILSPAGRAGLTASYVMAGYVGVLSALLLFGR